MIYLSLIPHDKKFLFILTESTAKDPSGDIVNNQLAILKETLGAKSLNNYVSASIHYKKIDNSKRNIRYLTFKYIDKITGEIKTGIEDTLTSTGHTEETKFIHTDDDLFALDLDPKFTHVIAYSLDNESIAYIYAQDLITSFFKSDQQYLHVFDYKVAKHGFID